LIEPLFKLAIKNVNSSNSSFIRNVSSSPGILYFSGDMSASKESARHVVDSIGCMCHV